MSTKFADFCKIHLKTIYKERAREGESESENGRERKTFFFHGETLQNVECGAIQNCYKVEILKNPPFLVSIDVDTAENGPPAASLLQP